MLQIKYKILLNHHSLFYIKKTAHATVQITPNLYLLIFSVKLYYSLCRIYIIRNKTNLVSLCKHNHTTICHKIPTIFFTLQIPSYIHYVLLLHSYTNPLFYQISHSPITLNMIAFLIFILIRSYLV